VRHASSADSPAISGRPRDIVFRRMLWLPNREPWKTGQPQP
jgi:hypothetical protein